MKKFHKNQRPQICFTFTFAFHFHFHFSLITFHFISQLAGRRTTAMVVTRLLAAGFPQPHSRQRLKEAWAQNVQDQAFLDALAQNVQDQAFQRLRHRMCKTRHFKRLWHRTCKTRDFLKNLKKLLSFYSKRAPTCSKPEVLHEKLKIVLPDVILKYFFLTPNFTKFLNP